jgi:NAD(P)-dependent dehydrogenase (short-subunit alcohol dehydrogenase family)
MRELRDRVAVVTGAAGGIGLALAGQCAAEGMRVVLADVDEAGLARAVAELTARGARALGVRTDVSRAAEVEALADAAERAFGATHVVCNNAGVAVGGPSWTLTEADWQWVLGVNLWGVIHGVRAFVPRMLASGDEGHVVNTASVAGLTTSPFLGPYHAAKHAVVALSEGLHHELAAVGARVRVSVVCPGFVRTGLGDRARDRRAALHAGGAADDPVAAGVEAAFGAMVAGGVAPELVAAQVLAAIREERFYVLTHPELKPAVAARMRDILDERDPVFDPGGY